MIITIQENLVLRNSNKVGQKNQAITQLSFIQPTPTLLGQISDWKGTHIIGNFLHLVLLHQEHFGDLLTWALEDPGN